MINLMPKKTIYFVSFFLISIFSKGQMVNNSFYKHLLNNNLNDEFKTYIKRKSLLIGSDSLNYYQSLFYLKNDNADSFLDSYKRSKVIFDNDSVAKTYASYYMMKGSLLSTHSSNIWYSLISKDKNNSVIEELIQVHNISDDPNILMIKKIPNALHPSFDSYSEFERKKPGYAALMSTFVPGLGKLYGEKKRSFYITLFSHVLFGLQTYESIRRLGVKNPISIINLSLSGLFYFSNIYGSYFNIIKSKKERRKLFIINATNYYSDIKLLY